MMLLKNNNNNIIRMLATSIAYACYEMSSGVHPNGVKNTNEKRSPRKWHRPMPLLKSVKLKRFIANA